jgi:hypothetical protein
MRRSAVVATTPLARLPTVAVGMILRSGQDIAVAVAVAAHKAVCVPGQFLYGVLRSSVGPGPDGLVRHEVASDRTSASRSSRKYATSKFIGNSSVAALMS